MKTREQQKKGGRWRRELNMDGLELLRKKKKKTWFCSKKAHGVEKLGRGIRRMHNATAG